MISLADRVFLQELAHVSTGEQMGNVCNSIKVTWASSSKYDEFSFCFSIAQFYKSNLITHVFVREIPSAQVHLLIQRHQWCLQSFGKWTNHWSGVFFENF